MPHAWDFDHRDSILRQCVNPFRKHLFPMNHGCQLVLSPLIVTNHPFNKAKNQWISPNPRRGEVSGGGQNKQSLWIDSWSPHSKRQRWTSCNRLPSSKCIVIEIQWDLRDGFERSLLYNCVIMSCRSAVARRWCVDRRLREEGSPRVRGGRYWSMGDHCRSRIAKRKSIIRLLMVRKSWPRIPVLRSARRWKIKSSSR